MRVWLVSILVCLNLTNQMNGARILGVFNMVSQSHYILASTLMKGLAEAGHDVTMVSPFPVKDLPKNGTWRDIVLDEVLEDINKHFGNFDAFKMGKMPPVLKIPFGNIIGNMQTEQVLKHYKMQELIKSGEKFDVIILPQITNDAFKGLASHFNAHLILFSNTAPNSWFNHLVGNPSLPSFYPEIGLGLPIHMNFFERLYNTLYKFIFTVNCHLLFYPKQNEILKKYVPNAVDLNDALYNVSLVLANSQSSLFDPQPLVPCIVEIGGFHISPPKKLQNDLQKWMDDAKEGVIYFSMGSLLKSSLLPAEKRETLLNVFGKRKEKVLWKWEDDILPGQPHNVKLGKWLPQQEILAHPNVKVFITHGGLLSTTETVYHGVPVVAIPIFGDQKMNANGAELAGYGIVLPFQELTENKLSSILDEIITNPKYRENVKERSRIMKDRQVSPLQTAVYWVEYEYVIRHNGAKHLRVAYLDMAWYQYYLLDIFAVVLAVLFVVHIGLKKAYLYLCRTKVIKLKSY